MSIGEKARAARDEEIERLIEARMDTDVHSVPIDGELHNYSEGPRTKSGKYVLWGHVYGDAKGRFPDGLFIRTSAIVKIEDGIALTLNSAYRLIEDKEETNDD
ncbi:hypothetical protein MAL1_00104 [Bacteriophage DSS3_MAL1]|nr:hypothetical protein MAL1_00104 [Bacteriophage DSS3_MAL1]